MHELDSTWHCAGNQRGCASSCGKLCGPSSLASINGTKTAICTLAKIHIQWIFQAARRRFSMDHHPLTSTGNRIMRERQLQCSQRGCGRAQSRARASRGHATADACLERAERTKCRMGPESCRRLGCGGDMQSWPHPKFRGAPSFLLFLTSAAGWPPDHLH